MSAKEALEYVGKISACDQAMAFDEIRRAARDEVLRFLTPQETALRNAGYSPESLTAQEERKIEAAIEGQRATFLLADTSQFEQINSWFSEGFEFCREDVLRIWPATQSVPIQPNSKKRPVTHAIHEAIKHLWPDGIPQGLKAKERNNQIAKWAEENGRSCPFEELALARAVQRALKSST
jgi:hypothetical protein